MLQPSIHRSSKVGFALIGAPGIGKTTIGEKVAEILVMPFEDMDNGGLELVWGKGGVERVLRERGDEGFLEEESEFVLSSYGRQGEGKIFTLDKTIFSSSGSLPLIQSSMDHIRERTATIYLYLPDDIVAARLKERGVERVVGMNGINPRFRSVEEVIKYRRKFYIKNSDAVVFLNPKHTPDESAEQVIKTIRVIQKEYGIGKVSNQYP